MSHKTKLFPPKPPTPVPPGQNTIPLRQANTGSGNGNVLVLGDDGQFHIVSREMWKSAPSVPADDPSLPTLNQLANCGVYLAELPDSTGGGIGEFCTFVNLAYIIQNG
jgi:hypothetical protein